MKSMIPLQLLLMVFFSVAESHGQRFSGRSGTDSGRRGFAEESDVRVAQRSSTGARHYAKTEQLRGSAAPLFAATRTTRPSNSEVRDYNDRKTALVPPELPRVPNRQTIMRPTIDAAPLSPDDRSSAASTNQVKPAIMFFNILTHVLIVVALLAMLGFVGHLVVHAGKGIERALRATAAMTGFLIYFGASALDISVPDLMFNALASKDWVVVSMAAFVIPCLVGTGVGAYITACVKKSADVAARTIALITTLVVVLFSHVYAESYGVSSGAGFATHLAPNLTFTISLALFLTFKYSHVDGAGSSSDTATDSNSYLASSVPEAGEAQPAHWNPASYHA